MGSQICFKQDVLNALRAAYVANRGSARLMAQTLGQFSAHDGSSDAILSAYNSGFAAALAAVALAFGLDRSEDGAPVGNSPPGRDRCRLPEEADAHEVLAFLWEASESAVR